jgi:polyisoprenyl-phosphate glycosyltransferase
VTTIPKKSKISVVTPVFNEEKNVRAVYETVRRALTTSEDLDYEHIFIDNASEDGTIPILRQICAHDPRVKVILNLKNFGQSNSPFHAFTQAKGDAVITFIGDMQDPPELLLEFIEHWRKGYKVVIGVKRGNKRFSIINSIRSIYYFFLKKISDRNHIDYFTGFGLYDKSFVDIVRDLDDPTPYFRGLVSDYAESIKKIEHTPRERQFGASKNNFYSLYGYAMLGFVNHSKLPIRFASFVGFVGSALSTLVAVGYLCYKLFFWDSFELGIAPLVIGVFFALAVNLFFLGILGEYVLSMSERIKRRPLVIEKERINF